MNHVPTTKPVQSIRRRSFVAAVVAGITGGTIIGRILPQTIRRRFNGAEETPRIRAVPHPLAVPRTNDKHTTNG